MSAGVDAVGIQSDPAFVSSYADSIVSAYSSVGKESAVKDEQSDFSGLPVMVSHIDNEKTHSEMATEQAIDFIQVLHNIHAQFQTTDENIAGSINNGRSIGRK